MRAAVQLLLVQACGEIYGAHRATMPPAALATMLQLLATVAAHARGVDDDQRLRHAIALAQAEDQVSWACRSDRRRCSCVTRPVLWPVL